jgi:hypothetical protein
MRWRVVVLVFFLFPLFCSAQAFLIKPSKLEFQVDPGKEQIKEVEIVNQSNSSLLIKTEKINFINSNDFTQPILLTKENSSFSILPFVQTFPETFTLVPNEKKSIKIKISLPSEIKERGYYGALLFSVMPSSENNENSNNKVIGRLGTLLFLKAGRNFFENGFLENFSLGKKFFTNPPFVFSFTFHNLGDTHLIPYGLLEIFNWEGKKVKEIDVDPYFVLPNSLRERKIILKESLPFGYYRALLSLNRGYKNLIDQKIVSFWVIPPSIVLILFLILFIFIVFLKKIKKFFSFAFVLFFPLFILAFEMQSPNYKILESSLNVGGQDWQTSSQYILRENIGEIAVGQISSAAYKILLGYRAMPQAYLSLILSTTSVPLLPPFTLGQNTAQGEFEAKVITDNSTGYSLFVAASSTPALCSFNSCFSDYTPQNSGIPDFNWQVDENQAEFGFTVEGEDIVQKFKDNSNQCNTGTQDTPDRCWLGFSSDNQLVSYSSFPNQPNGKTTTFKLKAEIGTQKIMPPGTYQATLYLTAIAN